MSSGSSRRRHEAPLGVAPAHPHRDPRGVRALQPRRRRAPEDGPVTDATALPRIPPRTMEIARLKATGLATKEVAHLLGVTEQTVKNHLSNLYAVLGVTTLE